MIENLIGKRYADALSDSIDKNADLIPALDNLREVSAAFITQSQLARFFAHPSIPPERKTEMTQDLCSRLGVKSGVRNMLLMLTERNKMLYLDKITEYFQDVVDTRLNQVRVTIYSAQPLTQENMQKLNSGLGRIFGKTMLIETHEDASLIGGIRLHIGDQVADATIINRLRKLRQIIEKEEVA